MEYVSKQEEDLRTDDVSRIAYQLLSAVDHCAKNKIIHRDIKPENTMFTLPSPGSDMKLIDFGSGTDKEVEGNHTTFAGSAFCEYFMPVDDFGPVTETAQFRTPFLLHMLYLHEMLMVNKLLSSF